jgi:hypothetical protein
MARDDRAPRAFAALIALLACAGLILQFDATLTQSVSVPRALWSMLGFFTTITNVIAAIFFTHVATHGSCCAHPRKLTGLTLSTLLVGIVYRFVLQGSDVLVGPEVQANILLHQTVPIMTALYWLGCVRKGYVGRHDPLLWAIYPAAYLVFALMRATAGDAYAYPFIDPAGQGWSGVAINVITIAAGFLAAGYGMLWLDRKLADRTIAPSTSRPLNASSMSQHRRFTQHV